MYALYKGEELLSVGMIYQIAAKMGVKVETIRYYQSKAYERKAKSNRNRRKLIKLED